MPEDGAEAEGSGGGPHKGEDEVGDQEGGGDGDGDEGSGVAEGEEMVVDKGDDGTNVNNCKWTVEDSAWHVLVCVKRWS